MGLIYGPQGPRDEFPLYLQLKQRYYKMSGFLQDAANAKAIAITWVFSENSCAKKGLNNLNITACSSYARIFSTPSYKFHTCFTFDFFYKKLSY